MGKQTQEKLDLETCKALMEAIEETARSLSDNGSNFVGRSWMDDSTAHQEVSEIYKDVVQKLREGFRRLSEAEDILEQAVPQKTYGRVRRLFLAS